MAIYRGGKCLTSKTAGKQLKKVLSGSRSNTRKTARKTAETPEKQSKQLFSGVFRVFRLFFRLFDRDPLSTFFGCFPAVLDGHRDCNLNFGDRRRGKNLSPGGRTQKQRYIPRKPRKTEVWVSGAEIQTLSGGCQNCGLGIHR